jgi:hypothetical protein
MQTTCAQSVLAFSLAGPFAARYDPTKSQKQLFAGVVLQ